MQNAFEQAGLHVAVDTLRRKRAISMAANEYAAIAYFPGYHCRHAEGFVPFEPIGYGPLGFAENIEAPVTGHSPKIVIPQSDFSRTEPKSRKGVAFYRDSFMPRQRQPEHIPP